MIPTFLKTAAEAVAVVLFIATVALWTQIVSTGKIDRNGPQRQGPVVDYLPQR